MHYNNSNKKNNPLSAAMRAKGWNDFEISGSRVKNEWSGYWVESQSEKEIDGLWLGLTYKEALYTIRNNFPSKTLAKS